MIIHFEIIFLKKEMEGNMQGGAFAELNKIPGSCFLVIQ
jgi:hypothetical protein